MDKVIETRSLCKRFGGITALRSIDMDVPPGVSGLIGPNGAGKTTTINILIGLVKPTSGEARVLGLDSLRQSYEIRRRVGVLHENQFIPGDYGAYRYLLHVAKLKRLPSPRTHVDQALKAVDLRNVRDRPVKSFSAGMLQRLRLAQALIGYPELVILDEPTANLDPLARISFVELVDRLHREKGVSFLISSHILPELEKVCSYVVIVNRGVTLDQGPLPSLKDKYFPRTYKIICSNPGLLSGKLEQSPAVKEVRTAGNALYVVAGDYDAFIRELNEAVSALNIALYSLEPVTPSLEDLFRKLVGG